MTLLIALFELPILLTKIYWQVVLWFVHLVIPIKRKCIKDQVVLITGAGAGIGKALANRFAEEGAKVAVVDINKVSDGLNTHMLHQVISVLKHVDVIERKPFPRYWPFVRGIHRWPVNSPPKGQWRGALMFSLIYARKNGWVDNREIGDLRRHSAHYDVFVMNS